MRRAFAALLLGFASSLETIKASELTIVSHGWVHSAEGLKLEIKTDKTAYHLGEPITLSFVITNLAGAAKTMQSGSPRAQFAIWAYRDGKLIGADARKPNGRLLLSWSFRPSDPVPVGKSHVETLTLTDTYDIRIIGQYTFKVQKWYSPDDHIVPVTKAKKGADYLEATTSFQVLPSESKPASQK